MDPIIREQYIASLILKERLGGLTAAEQEKLRRWREESAEHEDLYAYLRTKDFTDDLARYKRIDARRGWAAYYKRYMRRRRLNRRYGWAAAAMVALCLGVSLMLLRQPGRMEPVHRIEAISSKAILVLNGGETVDLAERKQVNIVESAGLQVKNDGKELQYIASGNAEATEELRYNELIIPKGGEFTLLLADGTKVYLNSQTRIRYPETFSAESRDVYLEGEAYFEVAKDSTTPFRVNVKDGVRVEVLGTSFNVRSYEDEERVEAVLEEGCVRMARGTENVVLQPGDRALCLPDGQIEVGQVNTALYTAWHKGQYIFENEPLEHILRQFERWYGIDTFYANEAAKSVRISGDVRRYDDITILLKAIEVAGNVRCTLNGTTLVVSSD